MDIKNALNKFLHWDTRQAPTPDQSIEVQEEILRLRAHSQMKELVSKYIQDRKAQLQRQLANQVDESATPDSIVRSTAARLREVLRWEQDIFLAEQQADALADWFQKWRAKLGF